MTPMILAAAGGSASGKTTLLYRLKKELGEKITVISHDSYYRAHDDLSTDERAQLNYDCPEAYETELLIAHLKALKNGEAVDIPTYDFARHTRSSETVHIEPASIIAVDGILILENAELRELFDLRVFVDAPEELRLARRIARDCKERGRSLQSVTEQFRKTVAPMHARYVEPTKVYADIILHAEDSERDSAAYEALKKKMITCIT